MPPSRRHTRTTTPPVRRRRVAGMRRPEAPTAKPAPEPTEADVLEAGPQDTLVEPAPTAEPAEAPPLWQEPEVVTEVSTPVIGAEPEAEPASAPEPDPEPDPEPAPPAEEAAVRARPSGKRRATGTTAPDDLAEAEADLAEPARPARPRRDTTLVATIALVVVALVLAGLAVWFRGEANSRTEGADTNNRALTDPATQSEVVRQLRTAIEKSLSYNYTDLDSTANAVKDNLSGKALCEYDQLFGEVKKLAPEQKIVLTTQVREIGVTRLEGNQALLLVFVDQQTTRADQNQTTASGAQFGIKAERQADKWRITEFDMLGQPLPNGKATPTC